MKWTRKGLIFDARLHLKEARVSVGYAQSPQAIETDEGVRVYFSTRRIDSIGKYLSDVFYADFDHALNNVKSISDGPVLPLGRLGAFDEHGIFPLNVLQDKNKLYGFIGGWTRRSSVSVDGAIGLAVSHDGGKSFQRHSDGPILSASLHEPFLVSDPFVLKHHDCYYMWYISGVRWITRVGKGQPERVYKIRMAASTNLSDWTLSKRMIIPDVLGPDECQALPSVCFYGGRFHMVFCYREAFDFRVNRDAAYRLGYAWSTDLMNWTRNDSLLNFHRPETGWDSEMMCYPHLCTIQKRLTLLYNGNQFGRDGFGCAVLHES